MKEHWKKKMSAIVQSCQKVFESPIFCVEKVDLKVDTFSGESMNLSRYALNRSRAVAILLYLTDVKKLVLVEQFRYSSLKTKGGWMTEIVAGLVDKGEDPDHAVIRELFEETGYKIDKATKIMQYYPSVGLSNQIMIHYFAQADSRCRVHDGGGLKEESEDLRVHLFSLPTAKEWLESGMIEDAKTIIALQHFFQHKGKEFCEELDKKL